MLTYENSDEKFCSDVPSIGKGIEQRWLASICVPNQCHNRNWGICSSFPVCSSM